MTEKELKKLNRKQLLEMLLIQTKRADELEIQLEEARKALDDREIALSKAGSIAEAALRLNGIFDAADAAAKQYLDNIKHLESALAARASVSGIDKTETESPSEPEQKTDEATESTPSGENISDSDDQTEICTNLPENSSEIKVRKSRGEKQCKTKKIIITKATAISTSAKNIPPEQNKPKQK